MFAPSFISQSLIAAVRDEDYSAADPLVVTFPVGAVENDTACADVTIIDDAALEGDHSFTVSMTELKLESGGTDPLLSIEMPSMATINIMDDESE